MRPPTFMCGVPIDDVTLDEAVQRVCAMIEDGRATGRAHQVATVNVDFLVSALADAEVRELLQQCDLAVPDGMPIVWGSRLLGSPVRERVAGADLVPALAARCASEGYSMYLFGGAEGVAEQAVAILRARHPHLRIHGDGGGLVASPEDTAEGTLARIRAFGPDVVCVALGHPKQERWIGMHRSALGVPVMMGVGGSIDFLTGHQRRAPRAMQRTGTEWAYRLLSNPRRLARRYARDLVVFLPRIVLELALTWQPRPLTSTAVESAVSAVADCQAGAQITVDLGARDRISHAELRALVAIATQLQSVGGALGLTGSSGRLATRLQRLHTDGLFSFSRVPAGPELRSTSAPAVHAPRAAPHPTDNDRTIHA